MDEQRYMLKKVEMRDFLSDLDQLWSQLDNPDSSISQDAKKYGIDIQRLNGLRREDAIKITRDESGLDMNAFVMAFVAHGVIEITKAAWLRLILPRIRANRGDDSIKPESDESDIKGSSDE
jgi:hypothetical protein